MTDGKLHRPAAPADASWSNRALLLSLAGIFFLTLYPFRFIHQESSRFLFPLSLEGWGKTINGLDVFLNVLLFIPFGFGLAEKLRERGRSKAGALLIVYASGAVLSYLVEFLQIYIPARDSGWLDVITNSSGAAVGALVFEACGAGIIAWFIERERRFDGWLNLTKIGFLAFLYVGFWCVLAGPLQRQTRLANWTNDSFLAVGDVASLQPAPPWQGRILQLDLWNRTVPAELAREITEQSQSGLRSSDPLIAFTLSGSAPFHDDRHLSPSLDWASAAPSPASGDGGAVFDGHSWLISAGPVPTLVSSIETTGQFAIHVVCQPAEAAPFGSRIISLSSPTGAVNLELRQYGSSLAFWFQHPFSKARARMTWVVPKVFAPNQMRNLLLSYDGSAVSLFVDGRDYGHAYQLGPGVALAHY
ncbi:MAG: VanZ family protein, partial [Terracidiphilus sp.]